MRPGRIGMWCMSLVGDSNAASMNCRPSERLGFLVLEGHRQCVKKHIIGRVRVCTFAEIAQSVEHSTCNRVVAGSIPVFSITSLFSKSYNEAPSG